MTACDRDDFPYEATSSSENLAGYWTAAIGLQQVDGIVPSQYLHSLAQDTVEGSVSLDAAGKALRTYYRQRQDAGEKVDPGEQEADFVSQRITELLARRAFVMAPSMLTHIHAYLFQDLDGNLYSPGTYKTEPLAKKEYILNGDSVLYGAPEFIDNALAMFFSSEASYRYDAELTGDHIEHFAQFISNVWQVHPFKEGNTRTIAVFSALYLDSLGFDVSNEPFAQHARYFRNALVRATYRNAKAKIMPELKYLIRFFDNMINGTHHTLKSRDLICTALFEDPTLLRNMPASEALEQ